MGPLMPSGMAIRLQMNVGESVAFTKPYMKNEQVLVTKKASGIQSVDGMKEKRLGAQTGSSGYMDFEANPKILKIRLKNQRLPNTRVSTRR